MLFQHTHTLGGVGWEPPPRGPHWDLIPITVETLAYMYKIYPALLDYSLVLVPTIMPPKFSKSFQNTIAMKCKVFPTYSLAALS